MIFNEIYPDFETFKNKINTVFEDTVQSTDEIFYVFIKNQFGKRNFLSADENFIQSKIFENWQILKQKWVKLLEINESSVTEILKQQTETETYKGNLTEIGSETKKFLDTGGSSNFTPAVITAIGRVIDLPNIYKSIGNLFQTLFFNIRVKSNGSSSTPKVEYTFELELTNPKKESFPRENETYPTFQNEVNEIFKKEIQELIDGGGGTVLPEKLSWLDSQLETLPNTTEQVFLNAVFIFYIKEGQKLFLATTILMLLDEVETNSNNIAGNASDIVDLEANVAGLVSQLNGLGGRLNEAESDISDNEILINENTASIQTIAGKTYIFEILDGLNQGEAFEKLNAHSPADFNKLSLFFGGCVFSIQSSSVTEFDLQGITQTNKQLRLSEIILTKNSTDPISKTLRAFKLDDDDVLNTNEDLFSSLDSQRDLNYRLLNIIWINPTWTEKILHDKIKAITWTDRKNYFFCLNGVFYTLSSFDESSVNNSYLIGIISDRIPHYNPIVWTISFRSEEETISPTSTTMTVDAENVKNVDFRIPFYDQQEFNRFFYIPNWPLKFFPTGQLSVINDEETAINRYTFNNFSDTRFDKGGEIGFTFSAVLSVNTQIGEPKLIYGLESIFKFTNSTWNSEKFVPVVNLTSPTGKVYSTHSIYKKGSLDYHYIHIFLSGFENIPNALDDEAGEWIIHFKIHHKSELSIQTRQIKTKNVKSKEDLFFEKLKSDYEKAKKMEAKNAKSRLN